MIIDANITVENNKVTFFIRDFSIKKTIPGVIMFDKKRSNLLAVGEDEAQVKESLTSTLPKGISDNSTFVVLPEVRKMFKDLLNMSYEETVKLCEDDQINGPEIVWERIMKNIIFVYPFDINSLDYGYMALFINYNLIMLTEGQNKGEGFIKAALRSFFQKFLLNITYKELMSLPQNPQKKLKKELSKALKAQMKISELKINGEFF